MTAAPSRPTAFLRHPMTRRIVAIVLVASGIGMSVWLLKQQPVATQVTFVMTDLEVPHDGGLLRFEDVTRLRARFIDDDGRDLASVSARGGAPVLTPPPVTLPPGLYTVQVELDLLAVKPAPGRPPSPHRLHRSVSLTLAGDPAELRL
ncbi:MAG: hypothetical protein IV100_31780 [Myxococcales bacterium]|nr:hypothetical protein [Myxococcales bacterium]